MFFMQKSKSRRPIIILIFILLVAGIAFWLVKSDYFKSYPDTFEPWYPATNENGDPVLGVFEGRIPCINGPAGCDKIKTALALYHNPETGTPTTYLLTRVYVAVSNDRNVIKGTWTTRKGVKDYPEAVVYSLDSNAPEEFRSYWKVNENIILPLDENMEPKVGTASWGYMLSRVH